MPAVGGSSPEMFSDVRTSPLRNVAVQPTFMHNGAFTGLEDAMRHHSRSRWS
jgi:cytochrome c peroxidase